MYLSCLAPARGRPWGSQPRWDETADGQSGSSLFRRRQGPLLEWGSIHDPAKASSIKNDGHLCYHGGVGWPEEHTEYEGIASALREPSREDTTLSY